jgi:hypothetical protein
MSILIAITISTILAVVLIYSPVRIEMQRQESKQKNRLNRNLSSRFEDGR